MLGTGTQSDPFIIQTPQDFSDIRNHLDIEDVYFELGNDIDMGSFGNFPMIGRSRDYFYGHLDGKGYTVSNITMRLSDSGGIFPTLWGATIKNIKFDNLDIVSTSGWLGALANEASRESIISNVHLSGKLTGAGYIISSFGVLSIDSRIENCYSDLTISDTNSRAGDHACGLSFTNGGTLVKNSFFNGSITRSSTRRTIHPLTRWAETEERCYYNSSNRFSAVSTTRGGLTADQIASGNYFTAWDSEVWGHDGTQPFLRVFIKNVGKVLTITVSSFATKINTNIGRRVAKQLKSFAKKTAAHASRGVKKLFNVDSYIKPTGALGSLLRRVKSLRIQSHIKPISGAARFLKKLKIFKVSSHMKPVAYKTYLNKIKTLQVASYVKSIKGSTLLHKLRSLKVSSHMKPINAHSYFKIVMIAIVSSFARKIDVATEMKRKRHIAPTSDMKPVMTEVSKFNKSLKKIGSWSKKVVGFVQTTISVFIPKPIKVTATYKVHSSRSQLKVHASKVGIKSSSGNNSLQQHTSTTSYKSGGGNDASKGRYSSI